MFSANKSQREQIMGKFILSKKKNKCVVTEWLCPLNHIHENDKCSNTELGKHMVLCMVKPQVNSSVMLEMFL